MRVTALLATLALSSCSLIGTRRPDPPPYAARPDCNDSYARPVGDTAIAVGGVGIAGLGATLLASTGGVNADGSSNVAANAALITSGVALAGLFVASAIIGYPRVGACHEALTEWTRDHPNELPPEQPEEMLARQYLRCPVDRLTTRELDFARGDARRDTHPWAQREISGCGRVAWCGEDPDDQRRSRCGATADLELASRQLAVETGCPTQQVEQEEFFGMGTQNTYRLNACGSRFSCLVPLIMVSEKSVWTGGRQEREAAAGSAFGSQLTCKPVAPLARPADQPEQQRQEQVAPPPPPPSQP